MATLLAQHFIAAVKENVKRPALHIAGVEYDYQHFYSRAKVIAAQMMSAVSQQYGEVRCALAVDKSVNGYASIVASQLAHQTWVPLNAAFPMERNLAILKQAKPSVLLLTPSYESQARDLVEGLEHNIAVILLDWDQIPQWAVKLDFCTNLTTAELAATDVRLAPCERPCDIAYIMFTSGSTGKPKGVSVTQTNVMAYLQRIHQMYQPTHMDRFSQFFEFTFDLSVHDLFVCWLAGGCLYPAGLADNLMPTAYARRHKLTFWFSVPTMAASLQRLGQLKPNSLPDLRYVLFCGEALSFDVVRGFQQGAPQARVDNLYGPTEATIAFTVQTLDVVGEEQTGIVPIGRAFNGLEVAVVDDNDRPCALGEKGELLLGGDQLALGYWLRADLTIQAFIELELPNTQVKRWYRSGDLAAIDEQGNIDFFGRKDNQIKIRGYRIELQEVEQWVAKALAVNVVAAVAVYDDNNAEQGDSAVEIHAFVLLPAEKLPAEKSFDSDEASLMAKCKAFLPAYMMPSKITCVSSMPTNASGKLDRKQLAQMIK